MSLLHRLLQHLGLLLVLVLCSHAFVVSSVPVQSYIQNATVHVEQLTIASKGLLQSHSYSVAVFEVEFNQPLSVQRLKMQPPPPMQKQQQQKQQPAAATVAAVATDAHIWQQLDETKPFGLFRLTCGTMVFESFPALSSRSSAKEERKGKDYIDDFGPPIYLYPLGSTSTGVKSSDAGHSVYSLLSSLSSVSPQSSLSAVSSVRFALVLHYRQPVNELSGRPKFIKILDEWNLDSCSLIMLDPEDQIIQPPIAVIPSKLGSASSPTVHALEGVIPFTKLPSPSSLTSASSLSRSNIKSSLYTASKFLSSISHGDDAEDSDYNCEFNPDSEPIFLETSSQDVVSFEAAVGNPIKGAVQGVIDMVTGLASSVFGGQLNTVMRGFVTPEMISALQTNLQRDLPPQIQLRGVHNIAARLKETIPPPCATNIANIVSFMVANTVTNFQMQHTTPIVSQTAASKVGPMAPTHVIRLVNDNLGRLLGRAISQSVVPSLSLTLEKSPLRYSWCHACREFGQLCQYCWQNAHNLYYGFYYSAYYSLYYCDYYGKWFNDIQRQFGTETLEKERKLEEMKNRFETVREFEDTRGDAGIPDAANPQPPPGEGVDPNAPPPGDGGDPNAPPPEE